MKFEFKNVRNFTGKSKFSDSLNKPFQLKFEFAIFLTRREVKIFHLFWLPIQIPEIYVYFCVPVKAEPSSEHATSSGCGTDDEESPRSSVSRNKRALKEASLGSSEPEAKRARRFDEELEEDERERMIRTFVEANEAPEEASRCVDVLRNELSMLRQLAEQKEHEWNQLIRLKGLKEEMLARLERRRVVLGHKKANGQQQPVIGEGRQGPILDVRSIIADYRWVQGRHDFRYFPYLYHHILPFNCPLDTGCSRIIVSGLKNVLNLNPLLLAGPRII